MEKARLHRIYWLLEVTERECYHELLLSIKNLQDLGTGLFPYIVPVLPHPLPSKVVKGKLFILVDLLKLLLGGSSQVEAVSKPIVLPDYLPLAVQDPKPAPQAVKKKTFWDAKAAGEGLEGFVD